VLQREAIGKEEKGKVWKHDSQIEMFDIHHNGVTKFIVMLILRLHIPSTA
jgi:hypothetical protein